MDQLRIYRLHPGRMDDFLTLWRDHVVPAREACGFTVEAAWTGRETDEFCWVVRHEGDRAAFEAADAGYYASPERAALPRDPRDDLAAVELRFLEPVAL